MAKKSRARKPAKKTQVKAKSSKRKATAKSKASKKVKTSKGLRRASGRKSSPKKKPPPKAARAAKHKAAVPAAAEKEVVPAPVTEKVASAVSGAMDTTAEKLTGPDDSSTILEDRHSRDAHDEDVALARVAHEEDESDQEPISPNAAEDHGGDPTLSPHS